MIILEYYPQFWMMQYLVVAINLIGDYKKHVSKIYYSDPGYSCKNDDYAIKFWWYGTKTICDEFGNIKYESCNGESFGTETPGF